VTSSSTVPGTKSHTTVRFDIAVAPAAVVAAMVSTVVPGVIGRPTLKDPSAPAVVVTGVAADRCRC
jgi:hypothetical protein